MKSQMTPAIKAAFLVVLIGALCLLFEPSMPWLTSYPKAWQLPLSDWVGVGAGAFLALIKPAARAFADVMSYPMDWVKTALTLTPWPFILGCVLALGWRIGGWKMLALSVAGLGFVLASGYWQEGMNTLALVAVSVPLALLIGAAVGILANEIPRLRAAVEATLDVMQTVPTFAYLTPLLVLFGFGPVVGLVASSIYAAPPMARNVLLGLQRVPAEVKEAAVMSGATRRQQLFQVELPAAASQIMVGVNQCLMAALSMVIIAAVIGGFNDIGWEVLLTMRKGWFGQSLMAGMVIVVFAILIDRMSATLAQERAPRFDARMSWALVAVGTVFAIAVPFKQAPDAALLAPLADGLDAGLTSFTTTYADALLSFKNSALYFVLLPVRIGFDQAVLPFTWGFAWTPSMSLWLFAVAAILSASLAFNGRWMTALMLLVAAGVLETGVSQLPWPFVIAAAVGLAWCAQGPRLAALVAALLASLLLAGLWERALLSLYLSGVSVLACVLIGGITGLCCAVWPPLWRAVQPVCDMLQTIPLFVFLIPILMVFQIGEFSAFLAIIAYAVVPMIRYTRQGLVETPAEMIEAATASGATRWQMLWHIRAPYAAPSILLGLNQTILYAFAMLVIAALIGTTGLGQSIYLALNQADVGLGLSAGAAMAILAFVADRIVQGFAAERRRVLGL